MINGYMNALFRNLNPFETKNNNRKHDFMSKSNDHETNHD
jgi:hypothetical protein